MRLNSVAETREVEIANLDRRYNDRETRSSRFARAHANRATHCIEVVQHEDRRLVEAEVLDRARDLAALDEKRSVARETGIENRARIDRTQIPEACDDDAALR